MTIAAISSVYTFRYNKLLEQQIADRQRYLETMRQFGVSAADLPSAGAEAPEERPKLVFSLI